MSEKMTKKVKALLTKAEASTFEAESDAFYAKAAELMAEYAIDEAALAALDSTKKVTEIETRRYIVSAPYSIDRMYLIFYVARAMGGDAFYNKQARDGYKTRVASKDHNTYAFILGASADIDRIEQMLESLNRQMEKSRESAVRGMDFYGMGEKKVWNATFIRGYASRIGERIRVSYQTKIEEQTGGVAIVLRDKQALINEELRRKGIRQTKSSRQHHQSGWESGKSAADRATIRQELQ